jgi:hypothetical protein
MNAEKLHKIAIFLKEDFSRSEIRSLLAGLSEALTNQVNNPAHPTFQQQVIDFLKSIETNLLKSKTNNLTPAWNHIINEIGAAEFIGTTLWNSIIKIFRENTITPTVAMQEINNINSRLTNYIASIEGLVNSFSALKIGQELLSPGECEIGIVIPRLEVKNELPIFGKELIEFNKILGVFSEVTTGNREDFKVRTISSSDLTVFLDSAPKVAACLAVAIERIIALYKTMLEIKKLKFEIETQGVPQDALKGIEDHANESMKSGLQTLSDELVESHYKEKDKGRKNELKIELKFALSKLANRIDRGYGVDVRVEPYIGDDINLDDEIKNDIKTIVDSSSKIEYFENKGFSILHLPESENKKP